MSNIVRFSINTIPRRFRWKRKTEMRPPAPARADTSATTRPRRAGNYKSRCAILNAFVKIYQIGRASLAPQPGPVHPPARAGRKPAKYSVALIF